MPAMLIIECNRCGSLLLSSEGQKTKTCTYCSTRLVVFKAKKLSSAKNAQEASIILKNLKNKKNNLFYSI
jgi:DNA-directed RNA polymerase subunit RPC12/RpoP